MVGLSHFDICSQQRASTNLTFRGRFDQSTNWQIASDGKSDKNCIQRKKCQKMHPAEKVRSSGRSRHLRSCHQQTISHAPAKTSTLPICFEISNRSCKIRGRKSSPPMSGGVGTGGRGKGADITQCLYDSRRKILGNIDWDKAKTAKDQGAPYPSEDFGDLDPAKQGPWLCCHQEAAILIAGDFALMDGCHHSPDLKSILNRKEEQTPFVT